MKHITFYLDFVSPYAYLAFAKLPLTLMGLSYSVTYKPVRLGAMLRHHGQRGPAEIPSKRAWTYRHVQWLAQQQQLDLQVPTPHPFSSLPLLRLALACQPQTSPSRLVCETLFRHVWQNGGDPLAPTRWQTLQAQLAPQAAPDSPQIKAKLRTYTDEALAQNAFGVPSMSVDEHLFWGLDALPMLNDCLRSTP